MTYNQVSGVGFPNEPLKQNRTDCTIAKHSGIPYAVIIKKKG